MSTGTGTGTGTGSGTGSSSGDGPPAEDTVRAVVFVRGRVQGVGFRWWTRARALELDLVGHARNLPDGRVEVCAQGGREGVEQLIELLEAGQAGGGRPGHVTGTTVQWHRPRPGLTGFGER